MILQSEYDLLIFRVSKSILSKPDIASNPTWLLAAQNYYLTLKQ